MWKSLEDLRKYAIGSTAGCKARLRSGCEIVATGPQACPTRRIVAAMGGLNGVG